MLNFNTMFLSFHLQSMCTLCLKHSWQLLVWGKKSVLIYCL